MRLELNPRQKVCSPRAIHTIRTKISQESSKQMGATCNKTKSHKKDHVRLELNYRKKSEPRLEQKSHKKVQSSWAIRAIKTKLTQIIQSSWARKCVGYNTPSTRVIALL